MINVDYHPRFQPPLIKKEGSLKLPKIKGSPANCFFQDKLSSIFGVHFSAPACFLIDSEILFLFGSTSSTETVTF